MIETASEKLINQGISQELSKGLLHGKVQMIIGIGREDGPRDAAILKRLREKAGCRRRRCTSIWSSMENCRCKPAATGRQGWKSIGKKAVNRREKNRKDTSSLIL